MHFEKVFMLLIENFQKNKINYNKLDMNLIREYFALFEREEELDKLLKKIKNAK